MPSRYHLLLSSVLLCSCFGRVFSQQEAQYSLHMLDPVQINPAYAGLDNSLAVTATYRAQWAGLDGSPTSQRLSAHLPLYFLNSGLGITVENDELGSRRLTNLGLAYNYQLVGPRSVWSLGFTARFQQMNLMGGDLRTPSGDYDQGVIVHNDDLLPDATIQGGAVGLGGGIYYQSERLEGGISVLNASEPIIDLSSDLSYRTSRTAHLFLLGHLDLPGKLTLHPALWVRNDGVQTQGEISARVQYDDNIFGGASFRGYSAETIDAVVIMAGVNLSSKLRLAYAYDLGLSDLRTTHTGSHEISLYYNLGKKIGAGLPPPIIYHPRVR